MSTWTRYERVTRTVVYSVPTHTGGACWTEVSAALTVAVAAYQNAYGYVPSDDAILVIPKDDVISIEFMVANA